MPTRRRFVQMTAAAAVGVLGGKGLEASGPIDLSAARQNGTPQATPGFRGSICFFSKHLPMLAARSLGRTVKMLGFDGVDLTVRPKGHIEPARVAQDLPPFVEGIRSEGVSVPMITTDLHADSDPAARPTLETAAKLEIPYFKPGYYYYKFSDVRKELEAAATQLRSLADLAARSGVKLGFHNHSGYVGGLVWDIAPTFDTLDPTWAGYYFDVRHAVAEGGDAGWRSSFGIVAPRLFMIAIKDFYWEKTPKGWRQANCPLGDGMVDWKRYFRMLADAKFQGPLSLHLEYDLPGGTPEKLQENTIAAAAKDLAFVKTGLAGAYGAVGGSR
jgi:L-ribulose-5-phosphate 3-epimerase